MFVGQAEFLDRLGCLAAADNGDALRGRPAPRRPPACRCCTARPRICPSARSRRPCVPAGSRPRRRAIVFGPMSTPIQPSGMSPSTTLADCGASSFSTTRWSTRQQNFALAEAEQFAGHVELVRLHLGAADALTLGLHEGVRHRPADEHAIDAGQQALDEADLVGNLGPAQDADKRPRRGGQQLVEDVQLLGHQVADDARLALHGGRDRHHRGVASGGRCRRRR